MAKKKKQDQTEDNLVAVEVALTKTERFIEDNKNIILYVVLGIAVIVLAVMGYQRYIHLPKEREAQEQMYMAEMYFEKDSFNLALQGDGSSYGFLDIIDEYGNTRSGNLAHYYAGICYLNLKNYDEAIDQLKDFNGDDEMIAPMAYGNIANAYLEKGETKEAAKYYRKAVNASPNEFTAPEYLLRLGLTYEILEKYEDALDSYRKIKKEYPNSFIGQSIEKYIARAEAKNS
ncbi:MAG: tetratricopeptide repeat protein [Bacteroidota bacterium]